MLPVQNKYKQDGLKGLSQSLHSQLAQTAETQLAKTVAELQSEVRPLVCVCMCGSCNPARNVLTSPSTGRPAGRKQGAACTTGSPKPWRRSRLERPASCRARYTLLGGPQRRSADSARASVGWEGLSSVCVCVCELQVKYQEGKKELSSSLYATMADTEEMKLAKAAMELQSQVC